MSARHATLTSNLPVPQSDHAAAEQMQRIGKLQRDLELEKVALNEELDRVKAAAALDVASIREELTAQIAGLERWADANRERLTAGHKRKTVRLPTGTVSWRNRPPKVLGVPRVPEKLEALIAAARAAGLSRFLRERVEVDKDAMLASPEAARTLPGIKIASAGEDFVVEPDAVELEGA
ncbi:MAG: host-nuclease inhibitor Gam family protein [Paracoccaceae bacterium]